MSCSENEDGGAAAAVAGVWAAVGKARIFGTITMILSDNETKVENF